MKSCLQDVVVRLSSLSDIEDMGGGQSDEYSPLKDATDASVVITFCIDNSRTDALHVETRNQRIDQMCELKLQKIVTWTHKKVNT